MSALLRKLRFEGRVKTVLSGADRGAGLEKAETPVLISPLRALPETAMEA